MHEYLFAFKIVILSSRKDIHSKLLKRCKIVFMMKNIMFALFCIG